MTEHEIQTIRDMAHWTAVLAERDGEVVEAPTPGIRADRAADALRTCPDNPPES